MQSIYNYSKEKILLIKFVKIEYYKSLSPNYSFDSRDNETTWSPMIGWDSNGS